MSKKSTTTRRRGDTSVRIDLYRDKDKQWRWRLLVPGHELADSGQGYSRRLDCLRGAMRVTGVNEITWLGQDPIYDYGQSSLGRGSVDFFIWHKRIRDSRP